MDYERLTAPCGLPCFECFLFTAQDNEEIRAMVSRELGIPTELAICRGCRDEGGKCAHLPVDCRLYPCAADKGVQFCCDCKDFPCDLLQPYRDRAELWHNTKMYNLCLIKKLGLESWAQNHAKRVQNAYMFEKWTL